MIDLDELRKLAEAATPGPWETRYDGYEDIDADDIISGELEDDELPEEITVGAGSYLTSPGHYLSSDRILDYDTSSHSAGDFHFPVANAEFIAAANPKVILELIERVREAEGALVELDDEFTRFQEEVCDD